MLKRIMKNAAGMVVITFALTTTHLRAQVDDKGKSSTASVVSKIPAWDVISIKPNKGEGNRSGFMGIPDGTRMENVTVKMIVANAYGVRQDLISGLPVWAEKQHFDIDAKVSGEDIAAMKNLTREQRRQMMLAILTDRFHWSGHIEIKELPIYELVVAKGGPKLKESPPNNDPNAPNGPDGRPAQRSSTTTRPGVLEAENAEMGGIAGTLAAQVERSVVDKTGLTGRYNLTQKWTPEQAITAGRDNGADQGDGTSLFTAQQEEAGLKLQPSKGPVSTLVADHIEMPTEN